MWFPEHVPDWGHERKCLLGPGRHRTRVSEVGQRCGGGLAGTGSGFRQLEAATQSRPVTATTGCKPTVA